MADYELLSACKFRGSEYVHMSDVVSLSDIAVLKSEVSGLHSAINEVAAKMDLVLDMHVKISVQNERLEQIVAEVGRVRDNINKEIGSLEVKTDNLATHSRNTRDRFEAWLNRIIGGVAVGAVLMGVLQYVVIEKLNYLEKMASIVSHNTAQIDLITRAIESGAAQIDSTHADQAAKELYGDGLND